VDIVKRLVRKINNKYRYYMQSVELNIDYNLIMYLSNEGEPSSDRDNEGSSSFVSRRMVMASYVSTGLYIRFNKEKSKKIIYKIYYS